jgi:phage gp29-like protein
MNRQDLKAASDPRMTAEIATRSTDLVFYSALDVLPNPDTVLRKLGKSQEVFDAIYGDAHAAGELRSIRAALLGYEWRVTPGGESAADLQAFALCEQLLEHRPAPHMHWSDVIWSMALSIFRGLAVHEIVWERQDRFLMPVAVIDRPQRRFVFDLDNQLRLLTREQPFRGAETGAYKWLLTRHAPTFENPYGWALFSSCFWPYTFKHGGYKWFVKFCEKYGLPWPIGKYPQGTPKAQQDDLADALAKMVQDGVAVIPDGGSVDLLSVTTGVTLPQERLINLCNREMSKALTSQTLATEIQDTGARAASETHREREMAVNECDRAIVEQTFDELFAWVTEINVAGALPPKFEFYEEADARADWAEVLNKARGYIDVPVAFAHDRLQIPMAQEGEEVLPRAQAPAPTGAEFIRRPGRTFAAAAQDAIAAIDAAADGITDAELQAQAEAMIEPVMAFIREQGVTTETLGRLAEVYPDMDGDALQEMLARMLFVAEVWGRLSVGEDA